MHVVTTIEATEALASVKISTTKLTVLRTSAPPVNMQLGEFKIWAQFFTEISLLAIRRCVYNYMMRALIHSFLLAARVILVGVGCHLASWLSPTLLPCVELIKA